MLQNSACSVFISTESEQTAFRGFFALIFPFIRFLATLHWVTEAPKPEQTAFSAMIKSKMSVIRFSRKPNPNKRRFGSNQPPFSPFIRVIEPCVMETPFQRHRAGRVNAPVPVTHVPVTQRYRAGSLTRCHGDGALTQVGRLSRRKVTHGSRLVCYILASSSDMSQT